MVGRGFWGDARQFCVAFAFSAAFFAGMLAWLLWAAP